MSPRARRSPQLIVLAVVALWAAPVGTGQGPAAPPPTYEEMVRKAKAYDESRSLLVGFLITNAGLAGLLIYHAGSRGVRIKHNAKQVSDHSERFSDHSEKITAATAAAAQGYADAAALAASGHTELALAQSQIRKDFDFAQAAMRKDFDWEQRQIRKVARQQSLDLKEHTVNLVNAIKDIEFMRVALAEVRRARFTP